MPHQFSVHLDNAIGSFASPTSIGNLKTELNGNNNNISIPVTLQSNLRSGNAYRIRVVSSTLKYASANNDQNIEILIAKAGEDRTIFKCFGSVVDLTGIYQDNNYVNKWNTSNPESVTQSGIYTLTLTNVNGCSAFANVDIRILPKLVIGNDTIVKITSGKVDLTKIYNTEGLNTRWSTANPTAVSEGRYRLIGSNDRLYRHCCSKSNCR